MLSIHIVAMMMRAEDAIFRSLAAIERSAPALQRRAVGAACEKASPRRPSIDELGTTLLRASLAPLRTALKPAFADRLDAIPLTVVNLEICNASAVFAAPEPYILIYRGLIRVTIFYIEIGELVGPLLDLDAAGLAAIGSSPDMLRRQVTAAMRGLGAYLDGASDLPWVGAHLRPAARSAAFIAFAKSLWFVVMHELGHLQLGHQTASGNPPPLLVDSLPIAEDIDLYKHQELEADGFVLQSLKPEFMWQGGSFLLQPLQIIAFQELWLGQSDSHPWSVNRMRWFAEMLKPVDGGEHAAQALQPFVDQSLADIRRGRAAASQVFADPFAAVAALAELYARLEQPESDDIDLDWGIYFARIVSEWWPNGGAAS